MSYQNLLLLQVMTSKKAFNYQDAQTELDALLARLQIGDMPLNEAVPAYERGMKLVDAMEAEVKKAENTLNKLRVQLPEA